MTPNYAVIVNKTQLIKTILSSPDWPAPLWEPDLRYRGANLMAAMRTPSVLIIYREVLSRTRRTRLR